MGNWKNLGNRVYCEKADDGTYSFATLAKCDDKFSMIRSKVNLSWYQKDQIEEACRFYKYDGNDEEQIAMYVFMYYIARKYNKGGELEIYATFSSFEFASNMLHELVDN